MPVSDVVAVATVMGFDRSGGCGTWPSTPTAPAAPTSRPAGRLGAGPGAALFPEGQTFSLDFHPIPYRGDPAGLENHHIPAARQGVPSVLSFFALEQESRVLCYANANLTRAEQAGEVMRFVEFWHDLAGADPQWLYFDSKVTSYPELSRLNQRGIRFATIRRRGCRGGAAAAAAAGVGLAKAVIDTPKRFHQGHPLRGRVGAAAGLRGTIRQVAVDGLGNERPTLLLSNDTEETARNLVIRYAGRNRVEDGLGRR